MPTLVTHLTLSDNLLSYLHYPLCCVVVLCCGVLCGVVLCCVVLCCVIGGRESTVGSRRVRSGVWRRRQAIQNTVRVCVMSCPVLSYARSLARMDQLACTHSHILHTPITRISLTNPLHPPRTHIYPTLIHSLISNLFHLYILCMLC